MRTHSILKCRVIVSCPSGLDKQKTTLILWLEANQYCGVDNLNAIGTDMTKDIVA